MSASSSQYSSRSFDETSALLPIETKLESPRPRASASSRSARPRAPLCDENAIAARRERAARERRVQPRRVRRDAEAVRADQPRAVRAHEREQLVLARRPSAPVSAKPAEMTQSALTPVASAARAASSTARAGHADDGQVDDDRHRRRPTA